MSYVRAMGTTMLNIFVAPQDAFTATREKPSIWFPLLTLALCWIVFWNWYYSAVDFNWVLNQVISDKLATTPPDQQEAVAKSMGNFKPGALAIISILTVLVLLLSITLINAVYLTIVSAVLDDKLRFRNWFSFSLWTSMPSLVAILAMTVNFLLSKDSRVGPTELNPLNFNNLLFHVAPTSPFKSLLDGFDLTILWSWALMVFGYRVWTGRTWATSASVVLLPWVVLYGIWIGVKLV